MSTWRARLAVLGVFLTGAVCGGALVHGWHERARARLLLSEAPVATMLAQDLGVRLSLTAAQRREVERIILATRARITAALQPVGPELAAIIEDAGREIRGHLDERRRLRFDAYFQQQRHHLERLLPGKPAAAAPAGS